MSGQIAYPIRTDEELGQKNEAAFSRRPRKRNIALVLFVANVDVAVNVLGSKRGSRRVGNALGS